MSSTGTADDSTAAAPDQTPVAFLGLNRRDTVVTLTLGILTLILLIANWVRLGYGSGESVAIERSDAYRYQVNLNDSGWVEWAQLDRIGETLARRIVEDRAEHGPFASIDDLQRVRGIGPATVETIRPWIACPECTTEEHP